MYYEIKMEHDLVFNIIHVVPNITIITFAIINTKDIGTMIFELQTNNMAPQLTKGTKVKASLVNRDTWHNVNGIIMIEAEAVVIGRVLKNNLLNHECLVLGLDNLSEEVTIDFAEIKNIWKADEIVSKNIL